MLHFLMWANELLFNEKKRYLRHTKTDNLYLRDDQIGYCNNV